LESRCRTVAIGGTFDNIHKGHRMLISKAFETGGCVLIGVSTDEFAAKLGKTLDHDFQTRVEGLMKYLDSTFTERDYQIVPLDDYFGIEVFSDDVDAVVVTSETAKRVEEFNRKRRSLGFKPLRPLIVETVLADDGKRISSTRIRQGEIDSEGHVLR
jgi:pantetheine-phosphate adenylyltransferase